jgi:3-deoxy-D-manno-octulosonate 8-phosphate phosphatase (KDO 8-P phosphatase)
MHAALARVRLFLCDVDGVLTDGGVYVGPETEFKRFNVLDGLAQRLLRRAEIKVGWISRRPSPATTRRAQELKVDYLFQQEAGKVAVAESILKQTGFHWDQVCYMGDDIVDLGVLRRVGVAVVPANGTPEAKRAADYITRANGGQGAVRETVELILKAQEKWAWLVDEFSS